eukprot:2163374-Pleurochrysis_carterae.AAC.2
MYKTGKELLDHVYKVGARSTCCIRTADSTCASLAEKDRPRAYMLYPTLKQPPDCVACARSCCGRPQST